jgi:hypothetical protein
MLLKARWLVIGLMPVAGLLASCECDDCGRDSIPIAWVRVRTSTATGTVADVNLLLERGGFTPLTATTDTQGEYTFDALEAVEGEQATLTVIPSPAYTAPEPRVLALVLNDTLKVEVVLEPAR